MRVSRNPDARYRSRNSASERWRPPATTSMFTSFAAAPRLSSEPSMRAGYRPSTINTLPWDGIAARQVRRIAAARSSSQSWITCFRTYASAPGATLSKKLPPTASQRSAMPASRIFALARSATCG